MNIVSLFRTGCAGIALALMPIVAIASPLTDGDIKTLRGVFGFDQAVHETANIVVANWKLDSKHAACARPIISATYSAIVDRFVREGLPNYGAAADWLRFADTKGGTIFLAAMRQMMIAKIKGGEAPDFQDIRSRMTDDESADVSAFLASPTGIAGLPKLESMNPQEDAALTVNLQAKCDVKAR